VLRPNPHAWQLVWSFVVAGLTVGWLVAPVRDAVSLGLWTAVGSAVGVAVGLAATRTTGSMFRASYAVVIGLLAAAVWLDAAVPFDTVSGQPTVRGVVQQVVTHGARLVPAVGSTLIGGWLASRGSGPRSGRDG
jgi:hypothetical protein